MKFFILGFCILFQLCILGLHAEENKSSDTRFQTKLCNFNIARILKATLGIKEDSVLERVFYSQISFDRIQKQSKKKGSTGTGIDARLQEIEDLFLRIYTTDNKALKSKLVKYFPKKKNKELTKITKDTQSFKENLKADDYLLTVEEIDSLLNSLDYKKDRDEDFDSVFDELFQGLHFFPEEFEFIFRRNPTLMLPRFLSTIDAFKSKPSRERMAKLFMRAFLDGGGIGSELFAHSFAEHFLEIASTGIYQSSLNRLKRDALNRGDAKSVELLKSLLAFYSLQEEKLSRMETAVENLQENKRILEAQIFLKETIEGEVLSFNERLAGIAAEMSELRLAIKQMKKDKISKKDEILMKQQRLNELKKEELDLTQKVSESLKSVTDIKLKTMFLNEDIELASIAEKGREKKFNTSHEKILLLRKQEQEIIDIVESYDIDKKLIKDRNAGLPLRAILTQKSPSTFVRGEYGKGTFESIKDAFLSYWAYKNSEALKKLLKELGLAEDVRLHRRPPVTEEDIEKIMMAINEFKVSSPKIIDYIQGVEGTFTKILGSLGTRLYKETIFILNEAIFSYLDKFESSEDFKRFALGALLVKTDLPTMHHAVKKIWIENFHKIIFTREFQEYVNSLLNRDPFSYKLSEKSKRSAGGAITLSHFYPQALTTKENTLTLLKDIFDEVFQRIEDFDDVKGQFLKAKLDADLGIVREQYERIKNHLDESKDLRESLEKSEFSIRASVALVNLDLSRRFVREKSVRALFLQYYFHRSQFLFDEMNRIFPSIDSKVFLELTWALDANESDQYIPVDEKDIDSKIMTVDRYLENINKVLDKIKDQSVREEVTDLIYKEVPGILIPGLISCEDAFSLGAAPQMGHIVSSLFRSQHEITKQFVTKILRPAITSLVRSSEFNEYVDFILRETTSGMERLRQFSRLEILKDLYAHLFELEKKDTLTIYANEETKKTILANSRDRFQKIEALIERLEKQMKEDEEKEELLKSFKKVNEKNVDMLGIEKMPSIDEMNIRQIFSRP